MTSDNWQQSFRALLPNININFSVKPSAQSQGMYRDDMVYKSETNVGIKPVRVGGESQRCQQFHQPHR